MHSAHPLRIFGFSAALTAVIAIFVAIYGGLGALWLFAVLAILEITFSFDNAVINSRILARMSPLWQKLFLTVGIFIAVFVVRFALPIIIVQLATGLGFKEVVDLALNQPERYGEELHHAAPLIDAFGGTFLLMIGLSYFLDYDKVVHWLRPIEHLLARAGKIRFIKLIIMAVVALLLYLTVESSLKNTVLISSIMGIVLQFGLQSVSVLFDKSMAQTKANKIQHQVGLAAFASFMYLEVLDASFSFDGVIGAFAITTSVLLIVAGLGVGAFWVRSLTVYLMRAGTLAKYRYLEHGAHWAILALGIVMLVKLYHVELPEWATGSLGLVFIATAVATSIIEKRRKIAK
ncbi:MAG: conserved rane protein of unknown function [Candidatus Saccharibacteria bacterium]|nr:conserved rane protein of unknown function [Candidatus Saccharibacteria bacterium]